MGEWKVGLCGCFGNTSLCCATFLVPILVIGKTGQDVDDHGTLWAVATAGNPCAPAYLRFRLREKQGIAGSFCKDVLTVCCCFCCSTYQMAAETNSMDEYLSTPVEQDIERMGN